MYNRLKLFANCCKSHWMQPVCLVNVALLCPGNYETDLPERRFWNASMTWQFDKMEKSLRDSTNYLSQYNYLRHVATPTGIKIVKHVRKWSKKSFNHFYGRGALFGLWIVAVISTCVLSMYRPIGRRIRPLWNDESHFLKLYLKCFVRVCDVETVLMNNKC